MPIAEAMLALVLADALLEKVGGDSLAELAPRVAALPRARLGDVELAGTPLVLRYPAPPVREPAEGEG